MNILYIESDPAYIDEAHRSLKDTDHTLIPISRLFHLENVNLNGIDGIVSEYILKDYDIRPVLKHIFLTHSDIPAVVWTSYPEHLVNIDSETLGSKHPIPVFSKAIINFETLIDVLEQ